MQLSVQRCCPGRQGHLRAGCYAGILKRLAGGRTAGQLVTRVATVHSACQRLRCLSWALSHRGRVAKRSAMAGAAAAAERRAIRVLLVEDEEIHRVRTYVASARSHAPTRSRSLYMFDDRW
jgi:hypothetical protein